MIFSTTLMGSNADIIGDALASVLQQVDRCVVIDTGAKDDTVDVARRVAGDKLLLRGFPWKNDFAAARNFALDAATAAGATWAVTLDTDQRLLYDRDFDLARALARTQAQVCMVADDVGSYSKERIVRLPAKVRWEGPTHECLMGRTTADTLNLRGVRFHELPKDPAGTRRKFERDVAILKRYTKQHAKQARWFYYLGASHKHLASSRRQSMRSGPVPIARLGQGGGIGVLWRCRMLLQPAALARRRAVLCGGPCHSSATAELAWLAGFAAYKAQRYDDAVAGSTWRSPTDCSRAVARSSSASASGIHPGCTKARSTCSIGRTRPQVTRKPQQKRSATTSAQSVRARPRKRPDRASTRLRGPNCRFQRCPRR